MPRPGVTMANKTVELSKPVMGHGVIRTFEFRDPTWRVIMEVGGEPYVRAPSPARPGFFQIVPIWERVQAYAEKLVVPGEGKGAATDLLLLGIEDTNRVKDAILDFFLDADPLLERRPTGDGSTTSPPSSGTISDGATPMSSN